MDLSFAESIFDDAPVIRIDTMSAPESGLPSHFQVAADVDRVQFYNVLLLSIASILVALCCIAPSIVEQHLAKQFGLRSPDGWSYVVILLATVQVAISLYAIRVPDWSTVWLLTITATCVAAVYAAGLALTMFASKDHAFLRQLGLLDEAIRYRVQPWCFFILCVTLILAFCCGRYSVRWHQAELQLATSRKT